MGRFKVSPGAGLDQDRGSPCLQACLLKVFSRNRNRKRFALTQPRHPAGWESLQGQPQESDGSRQSIHRDDLQAKRCLTALEEGQGKNSSSLQPAGEISLALGFL